LGLNLTIWQQRGHLIKFLKKFKINQNNSFKKFLTFYRILKISINEKQIFWIEFDNLATAQTFNSLPKIAKCLKQFNEKYLNELFRV
jgi:hypothetical protein